jgi:DNA-binding XRE family transcriptional regulator
MTPAEFKEARRRLGLSAAAMGAILATDPRTVRRWESEADPRPVNPIAARVVGWMLGGWRPPECTRNNFLALRKELDHSQVPPAPARSVVATVTFRAKGRLYDDRGAYLGDAEATFPADVPPAKRAEWLRVVADALDPP